MKRFIVSILIVLGFLSNPAYAIQYLSGLSSAGAVASTDTLAICQQGTACTSSDSLKTATMSNLLTYFNANLSNLQITPTDDGSHAYTVLSTALVHEIVLSSTFTSLAVPQAIGSFSSGAAFDLTNIGAVTVTSTISTINGIAGATGIALPANTTSHWTSDGTNWHVLIGVSGAGLGALATVTPGTGVATAAAVNIGSAGAFVVNGGALGTPSSGDGTNITNVNAAQLGGKTFASPAAIGTGTPAAGTFTDITAGTGNTFRFGTRTFFSSGGADGELTVSNSNSTHQFYFGVPLNSVLNFGGMDSSGGSLRTITLAIQSVQSGTSNTNGNDVTITGSRGTGTGTGGGFIFQVAPHGGSGTSQNTLVNAFTINGDTGLLAIPQITTDATHTDATLCEDTTTHAVYFGSGASGICLGTSSLRFKRDVSILGADLAQDVLKLEPIQYRYKPDSGHDPNRFLYGFAAEQVAEVMPQLVGYDTQGRPNSVDWAGIVPLNTLAIKELNARMDRAGIPK